MSQAQTIRSWKVLGCASQGTGSEDELRLRALLSSFDATFVPFDRRDKPGSFRSCLRLQRTGGFDLFVLEGTGVLAGLAAMFGRTVYGLPYVLSSGDAVGPFLRARLPWGAPAFALYEWLLYRLSAGFIGWTPYLVGRALTMGARRAITIPGWAPFAQTPESLRLHRDAIRTRLGIPDTSVVFGLVGSLVWSERYGYCYGSELIRAARWSADDTYVLIVGDGSGLEHLRALAGEALGKTIFLPGRVPRSEVPGYLAAMDVASLPQSLDGVGNFRYTTKVSEYRGAAIPFVANRTPMSYDLDAGDIIRLAGETPWSVEFIDRLAALMRSITLEDLADRRARVRTSDFFDKDIQIARATEFLQDVLSATTKRER
jgi:hypothetical protein